jgi:hypothetical protein
MRLLTNNYFLSFFQSFNKNHCAFPDVSDSDADTGYDVRENQLGN